MTQLREFAQHKDDFEKLKVRVVCISVDNRKHAHMVWEKPGHQQFTVLSDPDAKVIHEYGLLHSKGHAGQNIAIRATLVLDEKGQERWRRVSKTVGDIPAVQEVLERLREIFR